MKIVTRSEARASGALRYFTGSPCKRGHVSERLASNGACMQCVSIKQIARYHANIEEERRKQKVRRDSDPNLAEKKLAWRSAREPGYADRAAARRAAKDARRIAQERGESQYFTGKPCQHGHLANRFTNGGKCVECNRLNCLIRNERRALNNPRIVEFRRTMAQRKSARDHRNVVKAEISRRWQEIHKSRQLAIEEGLTTYIGKPCPKGHAGKRYTKCGGCVDCFAAIASSNAKKLYDANYIKLNRERIAERTRRYHERTAEKRLARASEWAARNKDKVRAIKSSYKARRRQQELGGDPTATIHAWEMCAPKVCHWCGVKCPKLYHVDHYVPLSKGGKHEVRNLVIACRKCNLKKSARDPYDFARALGRLF